MNLEQYYRFYEKSSVQAVEAALEELSLETSTVEVFINTPFCESELTVNIDNIQFSRSLGDFDLTLKLHEGEMRFCFDNQEGVFVDPDEGSIYLANQYTGSEIQIQF